MKFSTIFTLIAAAATTVSAMPGVETNAHRMARGLPPLPPVRRATPVGARRSTPSGVPNTQTCSTGPIQCCNSVTNSDDPAASLLAGLLGIVLPGLSVPIGLTCSPVSVAGGSGQSCSSQTVCCEDNSFSGLIAIGCTPININL